MTISTTDYFVRNVKAILARQGLNVSELAKLSGISQGGLSDLLSNEKGRSPSLEYAERIATALGYPLVALISDMEYPPIKCDMSDSIEYVVARLPRVQSGYVSLWQHDFDEEFLKIEQEFAHQKKKKNK